MRVHTLRFVAATVATVIATTAVGVPAASAATVPVAKVSFGPANVAAPAGYTRDTGAAFTAAQGSGWVRQDSLASASPVPLDLTSNTRNRARAGVDPLFNTLIHMQYGDTPPPQTSGVTTPGAWQYAVPVGTYEVAVTAGDMFYNSSNVVRVEGVTAIDHFVPSAATEFITRTVTVPVLDGMLTVDAIGGTNTKLNAVTIARITDDTTPPAVPTGLAATPGDRQAVLSWSAATDAAGYRVYRNGSLISGVGLVTALSYVDTTVANGAAVQYQVSAVDAAGNESARSAAVTVTPQAFSLRVNFSDQATTAPAGYAKDFGEAFDATRGYGWLNLATGAPLSLVGNGRNRGTSEPDVRLATLMHTQLPAGSAGVSTPGKWEAAVPNGAYTATVAVGDAGGSVDSVHYANVEDQNAIAAFAPTTSNRYATGTVTVTVTDGRLTLSPASGTNTKYLYVDIASVPMNAVIPSVRTLTPANLGTGFNPALSVLADLRLPNGAVDPASLNSSTVTLTRVSDGSAVAANVVTSGGGDTINLSPSSPLAANTLYRFNVTSGVRDLTGAAFQPYRSVFTTGSTTGGEGPTFTKVVGVATGSAFTSVVKGPDGRLYAGTLDGYIHRFPINADGTLGTPTVIDSVRAHATAAGLPGAPRRTVIGMAFDPASTAANPILWISDNYQFIGVYDVPDWSSKIAKLTGPDLGTYTEVVTDLPRSVKDHETNSLAFGPDGALYISQGSNNGMGAPEPAWGNRPDRLLSAAVLRLDPALLPATLPLNVKTEDGGSYNPRAAGAPLTIHATGVRNAYDLVWHRNGHLYAPTNGSAAGGNTPATPTPLPASCANRPDGPYTGPSVPAINGNPQAETDFVFDVRPGRYYGHPNPTRCEWVLNGGNPTGGADPYQVDAYPVGTLPDRNYDVANTYDAGLHASANGAVEYIGGALDGKLLVVRYSVGQDIETFDVASNGALSNRTTGITGFTGFNQPLDVTQDIATGNLYVTELGANRITLLRPAGG
ncbi:MAG TPA: Ig-like domain-containing protein [Actinoplanes sp.]|nr:Ig-like domain-containing protein [Actinoplanes sp.]